MAAASPTPMLEEACILLRESAKKRSAAYSPVGRAVNVSEEPEQRREPPTCIPDDDDDDDDDVADERRQQQQQQQPSSESGPHGGSSAGSSSGNSFHCCNQLRGGGGGGGGHHHHHHHHHLQLLIPVMSPSEGLIYKPYPGPGCHPGRTCGGCGGDDGGPQVGNFLPPTAAVYGIPSPPSHYPAVPFPSYFPTAYGMMMLPPPFMNDAPEMSDTSVVKPEQQQQRPPSEDDGVRGGGGGGVVGMRKVVAAFGFDRPIKVVPRNGVSASESAARIFRSIQLERKQDESV
ncbi:hypothetical protein M569_09289 [Genlisea aurea]|uniref:Uncharacterized protein n=1 Tax=Genlisea aurea TaxID=192259 RepID=S8CF02_9LAMI|nr:hypothetical protein M569_09289 [Genlisea aurea]